MEQEYSLTWTNFTGNLSKGFTELLGSGEFVDVTIAVEGKLLKAHQVILSICSPYFRKMLHENPCRHPIVVLKDISYNAMYNLLYFMYNGEVSIKQEELTTFITTADLLEVKGLCNKDEDKLINSKIVAEDKIARRNTEIEQSNKQFTNTSNKIKADVIKKRKSTEFLQNSDNNVESQQRRYSFDESKRKRCDSTEKANFKSYMNNLCDSEQNKAEDLSYKKDIGEIVEVKLEDEDLLSTSDVSLRSSPIRTMSKDSQDHDYAYHNLESSDKDHVCQHHIIVQIPQKEAGKKKYPQRSCRMCHVKYGKRRDTRFMCELCKIPFCRGPCFEEHLYSYMNSHVVKCNSLNPYYNLFDHNISKG